MKAKIPAPAVKAKLAKNAKGSGGKPAKQLRGKSVFLASYTVRIWDKQGEPLQLESLGSGHGSFRRFLVELLEEVQKEHDRDEGIKSVIRTERHDSDGATVRGRLLAGEYGYATEIVDSETYKSRFKRAPTDAEVIPFFVAMHSPKGAKKGILVLQRYGNLGITTAFSGLLRRRFGEVFPDLTLQINRQVPQEVVDLLAHGKLKRIDLVSHLAPKDVADRLRLENFDKEVGRYTVSIRARKKGFLTTPGWLDKLMAKRTGIAEIEEGILGEGESLSVAVQYGNRTRVVDFAHLESIAPYLEVSDNVEFGADGHPTYESISQESLLLLAQLKKELGLEDFNE